MFGLSSGQPSASSKRQRNLEAEAEGAQRISPGLGDGDAEGHGLAGGEGEVRGAARAQLAAVEELRGFQRQPGVAARSPEGRDRHLVVPFPQVLLHQEVAADAVLRVAAQLGHRAGAQRAGGGKEAGRATA